MKNNKILYIVITILVFALIGGGLFFFLSNKSGENSVPATESPVSVPSTTVTENKNEPNLSEQPNQGKFNEYFIEAYLAKLPAGSEFDPFKIIKTKTFTAGEQFCISLTMKKQIPANTLSTAIYDVSARLDVQPRGGTFPQALGPVPGGSAGPTISCEPLMQSVGKYEYKVYMDDILVIVLPFEVK
jgi:hypothetical protein